MTAAEHISSFVVSHSRNEPLAERVTLLRDLATLVVDPFIESELRGIAADLDAADARQIRLKLQFNLRQPPGGVS